MANYPEHEKIDAKSYGAIQEFTNFLRDNNYAIVSLNYKRRMPVPIPSPVSVPTQRLIDEFFEVDPVKLEKERRAMLEEL